MKRFALCFGVLSSLCGTQSIPCPAQQPAGMVFLNQSRDWLLFTSGWGDARPLAREIARQAFLLAARDESGLTTRDALLGDSMPAEGGNAPWDLTVAPADPAVVKLVRGFPPNQTEVSRHELKPPVLKQKKAILDYRLLTELEEKLSRTEYVNALKQAGFQGKPNAHDESIAVPGPVEKLLGEMNFLAQFRAVRELHELMRSRGESLALLGALVRGYANLGVLTEFYWHPAHKVFKARALIYAQRMLARNDESPLPLWHRAYAAALAGDPRWALADLKEGNATWEQLDQKDRPPQPAWMRLVGPLCQYDIKALDPSAQDPKLKELAALLRFLAVEQAGRRTWAVQTALESLEVIPQCYRIHDTLCELGGVATLHSATLVPVNLAGETLYSQVRAMPGLPEPVRKIAGEGKSLSDALSSLLGIASNTPADEFTHRKQLTRALLKTGDLPVSKDEKTSSDPLASDAGEPSWVTLGMLIRELSFMQVYRRARFERYYLGVPTEQWLASAAPLVEGHLYRAFLDTYSDDADKAKDAVSRLVQADLSGLECNAYELYGACRQDKVGMKIYHHICRNLDYTAREIVATLRVYADSSDSNAMKWMSRRLLDVSPNSPLARTFLVVHDWDGIQAKVAEWDTACDPYPSLASALGDRYIKLERWKDAERVLKAALDVVPSDSGCRRQLAFVYKKQGQTDRWVATLEEQLKQPDYYLDHASVQSEIANHYMSLKQWEKGLPYAEGAAESYSGWGLLCAGNCYEALQRWEEAEKYYQATSGRYPSSALEWCFFCRRTGKGDLESAHRLAEEAVAKSAHSSDKPNRYAFALCYLLEGQPEKALPEIEGALAGSQDAQDAIWLALIADQVPDAKKREAALNQAKELATKQKGGQDHARNGVLGVVELLTKDLANGGKGQIDLEAAGKLGASWTERDRLVFHYALAQYLNLRGQHAAADRYWKQCMGWLNISAPWRTLAGAALLEHGIKPDAYKSLLEPAPEEPKKPATQDQPKESKPQESKPQSGQPASAQSKP